MTEKKSFWATIPGLVTGLATIITAVVGLFAVLPSDGDKSTGADQSPSPSASPSLASPGTGIGTSGSVTEAKARVTPKTVDFGKRGVGSAPLEMTVTLENAGTHELNIDSVGIGGADASKFEVAGNDCGAGTTVLPQYDCRVTVRFLPQSAGDFRATLTIDHNSVDGPSEVLLLGTATLLPL